MTDARFLLRAALVLVFVSGAWADILPGLDRLGPATSAPVPVPEEDADDGVAFGHVPPEAVLMVEAKPDLQLIREVFLFSETEPQARQPVILRRILHVPLSGLHS